MLLLTLLACGWNQIPNRDEVRFDDPLWDASSAIPTINGVYVSLPYSGGVALVPAQGEARRVDIGEGRLSLLDGVDGSDVVIALVERTWCDAKDPKDLNKMDTVDDCPYPDRVTNTDVMAISTGEVLSSVSIGGRYNRVAFSDDARFAVAYLDLSDPDLVLQGVIDLTSVVVINLADGRSQLVNVGFATDRIRFQTDGGGQTTGAVILSRSEVAQVDLSVDTWEVQTTYNLSLDPDSVIIPSDVELTPDGRYALITVEEQADLYALDLFESSINLIELAGLPADLEVCESVDLTVVVYTNTPLVEVIDHERFDVQSYPLDEPVNQILEGEGFVVLYSDNGRKDAYRLDLITGDLVEYRLENPPIRMDLAPTGEFAVAFTRAESGGGGLYDNRPGMEVLDLSGDKTQPYLLEGVGVGMAFTESDGRLDALVLQEGINYLYQLDLYTGDAQTLDLEIDPVGIGTMPGGRFYITHTSPTGAMSFLDPVTGEITGQYGFATLGVLDPIELVEAP